ncbi:MAG TPA: hypothetical protein VFV67_25660 [Actinophytocola sp.]|uniref:hypothetical protein n=1 Tax=Actinophytocola sp. TaxID=1872138 RepID=UPI002DB6746D|nr:hypothetical protein [Actinophytocola sp.]HEU5474046.1 hypothetical protein [Actinophytocola sp.]
MLIKIIGAIILIWLAFLLFGWVFKALGTLIVIALIVTAGVAVFGAIKGKSGQRHIKP